MHARNETLSIGWCDGGSADGLFTHSLVDLVMHIMRTGIDLQFSVRVHGNQIARQRERLLGNWVNELKTDWLLWVDSDIVLTIKAFNLLWETADETTKPVVSGVYFISKEAEQPLMRPLPCVFMEKKDAKDGREISYVHPLPQNQVIQVDASGMGLVLMHKSVAEKLGKEFPNEFLFAESEGNKFVGEDISFYRKLKKINVPLYVHTGALVRHMKRFSFDADYYSAYWGTTKYTDR